MKLRILVAVVAALAILPASAEASYNITQRSAEYDAMDAADYNYEGNGVVADDAYCRPQFSPRRGPDYRYHGRYHRWTCVWVGTDEDNDPVFGTFRITGHTGDRYGYLAVNGGLRWF